MRVLVLEDDAELRDLIGSGIRRAGIAVDTAATLAEADVLLTVTRYDCLVADRGLPDGDGADLVTRLRADGALLPILLLTALGAVHERVDGFERGADDYLVKPFAMAELVARVRALTRRTSVSRAPVVRVGDLELDLPRRRVVRAGVLLSVTAKEFAVLDVLAENPGDVVTRSELIDRCWDEQTEPMSNVVDVLIGQLRKKLGPPDLIETVRGIGYRLREDG